MESLPTQLEDIEHNFKVTAGPGAGKTHWLANHIINVLRNSTRLGRISKIACITYTNAASEEIIKRLNSSTDRVEVSTIHGFLYSNVVKPFISFLRKNDGKHFINVEKLNGHDEHIPSDGKIHQWVTENYKYNYLRDDKEKKPHLHKILSRFNWKLIGGDLVLYIRRNTGEFSNIRFKGFKSKNGYSFPLDEREYQKLYFSYKEQYWNDGQMHHEDVLYFAYRLINEFPSIASFICAKFPYLFVDEFQDTSPIQTAIIKKIGEGGTVIGVIGDPWQSIYEFHGARKQDFTDFTLQGMRSYKIEDNWRSTENIISFLKNIRTDITQYCQRKNKDGSTITGNPVKLIIGDKFDCINNLRKEYENLVILARKNETVNHIRHNLITKGEKSLIDEMFRIDSSYKRSRLIRSLIKAFELTDTGSFKEAANELLNRLKNDINGKRLHETIKKRIVLALLYEYKNERKALLNKNLFDFYNDIHINLNRFDVRLPPKIVAGKFKEFTEAKTVQQIALCLSIQDEKSFTRTIHRAKGTEFNDTLVILEDSDDLEFLLKPSEHNENHRIFYVAVSRAKENLFINAPSIPEELNDQLNNFGIELLS